LTDKILSRSAAIAFDNHAYRVLDSFVLPFNVAGFAEAFIKSGRIAHIGMGRLTANDFDDATGQRERLVASVPPGAHRHPPRHQCDIDP